MRDYRVAVFPLEHSKQAYIAYLRDYTPAWKDCCLHEVQAPSGVEAKRKAIQEHRESPRNGDGLCMRHVPA